MNLKKLEKTAMRRMVVETGERVDGRSAAEIRPIMVKGDYLPPGSRLRPVPAQSDPGALRALLGMLNEGQRLDTIEPVDGKRYMHHYNFPPYCTGETGRMGTPKRREIGHGNLCRARPDSGPARRERVPLRHSRCVRSHGVQRLLFDGFHLRLPGPHGRRRADQAPVSGIAMGLIQEEGKTVVLSDIQGLEGTSSAIWTSRSPVPEGITAADGQQGHRSLRSISCAPLLQQAKEGRAFILDKMLEVVPEPRLGDPAALLPRSSASPSRPRTSRDVIGKGGETIRGIQDETGASVDIHEDGTVYVGGVGESVAAAIERIKLIVKGP